MSEDVVPFDLVRMFIGKDPPLMLLEILFRSIVIYSYTFVLLRWIGGRSVSQFSLIEFLLVIALGSAVGDAMFYPEVPLLHAMLVVTVIVIINKGIDYTMTRHNWVKKAVDGVPVEVMREGRLNLEGLLRRNLPAGELLEQLRIHGIRKLSQVTHAYVEPSGALSLFCDRDGPNGLDLVPPDKVGASREDLQKAADDALFHCLGCGANRRAGQLKVRMECDACGRRAWLPAFEGR